MLETEQTPLEKKEKFRKKFFRDLTSGIGTIIVLVAINLFLTGGITWSKYPIFFYGIFMLMQFFKFIRVQYFDEDYNERESRRDRRQNRREIDQSQPVEDYSDELLRQEERELADLKEYRQPGKPWKDEDLV